MPENPFLPVVTKSFASKHLAFDRHEIERLAAEALFEVVTPAGTFRMSRAEFEAAFPEVTSSVSYTELGEYHFPRIPYKAFRFLVRPADTVEGEAAPSEDPLV